MKHPSLLAALLLALLATTALADSPAKIAEDYHRQADAALERLNSTLEKATTPLIAALIKAGDPAGAGELTAQLKSKTAGEPVPEPHASAALLFAQYDQARMKALQPAQKAAIARIDAMLSGKEGKDLDTVTELGKVRGEVEAGKAGAAAAPAPPDFPLSWDYFVGTRLVGLLVMKADGTLTLQNVNADGSIYLKGNPKKPVIVEGRWEKSKSNVLKITLNPPGEPEECDMIIDGRKAVMRRPVGDRTLTAR